MNLLAPSNPYYVRVVIQTISTCYRPDRLASTENITSIRD